MVAMKDGIDGEFLPPLERPGWRARPTVGGVVATITLVAAAILIGHGLWTALPAAGLSLLFIVAVLISAISFGFWVGLIGALLSFLAYNFFFVEPIHTFSVAEPADVLVLAVFLIVAALTGLLAGRAREEADAARRRAEMLERLAAFSADLSTVPRSGGIDELIVRHLGRIAAGPAILLRKIDDALAIVSSSPDAGVLDDNSLQAADWVQRHGDSIAATAPGWHGNRYAFFPLKGGGGAAAVAGAEITSTSQIDRKEREHAVHALLRQAEIALERTAFEHDAAEARATAEQERLRSALLSSISHDLRTPLATILGSVTSLRELGNAMPTETRADLLLAIEEEADRLSRHVANLLAMTRLEAKLNISLHLIDVGDAVHAAVNRARRAFSARSFVVFVGPSLPLVRGDIPLLEQVMFNLIDNAVRHSPADQPVEIAVREGPAYIELSVTDHGRGVPANEQSRIFDKFYSRAVSGTGLGLAICREVVTLFGGSITIISPLPQGTGACFTIQIPVPPVGAAP